VFLCAVAGGIPAFAAGAESDVPAVRVLVLENQRSASLTVKGPYRVRLLPSLQVIQQGPSLSPTPVAPTAAGIRFGSREWAARGVRVEQQGQRDLFVNDSRFRGSMDLLVSQPGRQLYAINRLEIEGYLYGVLHHEVSAWWPMEALKAQAVAARTYALYQARASARAEYDLKSSTSSQVYGGSTTERFRTTSAVDATAGQVLTYQGKIFPAYFHATCAGLTAAADELWKISLKPIGGGVRCGFCRVSPHYQWTARVPLSEIEEKLAHNGRPIGQLLKIELLTRTPSYRVGSLRLTGTGGEVVIAAKDFRVWIGGDRMRSTSFTVRVADDSAEFHGRGWGHGVGLCQWGALGQSLLGRKYAEILRFYYRDSEITGDYAAG